MDSATEEYGDKTQRVLAAIRIGGMSAAAIASSVKCSIPLVYTVARAQGIKLTYAREPRAPRNTPHSQGAKPLKKPEVFFASTGAVEIVAPSTPPVVHVEVREDSEARVRARLAKQLEEIYVRQRSIWGRFP